MPEIRLQVYFIENEEYFKRKGLYSDSLFFEDNDELMCILRNKKNSVGFLSWKVRTCIFSLYKTYYSNTSF